MNETEISDKNNCEELASFARSVSSNWFITDQKVRADFKKGFDSVFLHAQQTPGFPANSESPYGQGWRESNPQQSFWRALVYHLPTPLKHAYYTKKKTQSDIIPAYGEEFCIRRVSFETNGSVTPTLELRGQRGRDLIKEISEKRDGLREDLRCLMKGTREGYYNGKEMAWQDANGGRHSQRCNAAKIIAGGHNPLPDNSNFY